MFTLHIHVGAVCVGNAATLPCVRNDAEPAIADAIRRETVLSQVNTFRVGCRGIQIDLNHFEFILKFCGITLIRDMAQMNIDGMACDTKRRAFLEHRFEALMDSRQESINVGRTP